MNYRICIASYKRHKELGEKTLKTLDKFNIDKSIIDIFVADKEEYDLYKPLYPDYNIIIGIKGLLEIRNFITDYYEEGQYIVSFDDDITDIKMKNPKEWEQSSLCEINDYPETSLSKEIELGFKECQDNNTILWGIFPCDNSMMMKNKISTHLLFCGGWMWGCIIDKECLKLNIDQYDDYERTIKVFKKYGKVVRLNYLCCKTKYNKNKGGACGPERIERCKTCIEKLVNMYPDNVKLLDKKASITGKNPRLFHRKN
tara:strand:- start:3767 stop:4537 length:771 start_codon:yes stop_codon:yes gene_type:complete